MESDSNSPITVFPAREVVTMNPSNPAATHVAVRDGRVLGAGPLEELETWGPHVVDDRFGNHVLVPGLIDVHTHTLEGAMWAFEFLGYFPRTDPDGNERGGLTSARSVIEEVGRLAAAGPVDELLVCWGFDPIYFPGERLTARHLDAVVPDRPVFLFHASAHVATVNSAMLRLSGITSETETEGVVRDGAGEPTGELQEIPAMMHTPAFHQIFEAVSSEGAYHRLGRLATNAGMTTIGDLAAMSIINPSSVEVAERVVTAAGYPLRIVQYPLAAMGGAPTSNDAVVDAYRQLKAGESEMLRFGGIKIVADGSIQGYTAVMNWPGYVTGAPNGLWQVPPDSLPVTVSALHRAGIPVHVHCNGDALIDAMIDAVDQALREHSWLDHRHTVQHCQLTTAAQFRRMAKLGICGNIFANHLWYWGDQHYESTVGPERANRMEACATALREGVSFSLHADAAVTPIGQLHSMWCAVNRVTPKGRVLGSHERISPYDALAAVTIGAAYQMHLDDELGTIEVGKRADFTVLEENPLEVDPMGIKDIGVWGTVVNGEPHPASTS